MGSTIPRNALVAACVLLGISAGARAGADDANEARYQAKYLVCLLNAKAADEARAGLAGNGAADQSQLQSAIDDCAEMKKAEMFAAGDHWDCADRARWIASLNNRLSEPSKVADRAYDEFCSAKK